VEWKWQGKTEVLGEKHVPVPFCPPQIPHGLNGDRSRASAVRGRRLTACAMARPSISLYVIYYIFILISVGDKIYKFPCSYVFVYSLNFMPFRVSLFEFSTVANSATLKMDAVGSWT
jgi:hypothetical protein